MRMARVLLVRREDLDDVAAHAERAAVEVDVVALVLDVDERPEKRVALELLPPLELLQEPVVRLGGADAVDAGDRRDDDHVVPREQRVRRRVAHAVDLVVDDRVLLDVRVGRRDVRLGLVVVVVADEVLDGVVGEELLELAVELRRERLVVRDDQRRPLHLRDHVRDREGLARAGDAEQHLVAVAAAQARRELLDGPRLVARGLEVAPEIERHDPSVTAIDLAISERPSLPLLCGSAPRAARQAHPFRLLCARPACRNGPGPCGKVSRPNTKEVFRWRAVP